MYSPTHEAINREWMPYKLKIFQKTKTKQKQPVNTHYINTEATPRKP